MSVIEFEKELKTIKPVESLAFEIYKKQLKAITNISNTD
jgi:hypothetical protein